MMTKTIDHEALDLRLKALNDKVAKRKDDELRAAIPKHKDDLSYDTLTVGDLVDKYGLTNAVKIITMVKQIRDRTITHTPISISTTPLEEQFRTHKNIKKAVIPKVNKSKKTTPKVKKYMTMDLVSMRKDAKEILKSI